MTGFDGSPAMVELARQSLGDQVPIQVADLAAPLPFSNDSFDDVVASLVLHYFRGLDRSSGRTAEGAENWWSTYPLGQPPHRAHDQPS